MLVGGIAIATRLGRNQAIELRSSPSTPIAAVSSATPLTPGSLSPISVAATLFNAQRAQDRAAASRVASDRVVKALFDPLPQGADPRANSLGTGLVGCTPYRNTSVCTFADSTVKVIVKQTTPGHYVASRAFYPLFLDSGAAASPTPIGD